MTLRHLLPIFGCLLALTPALVIGTQYAHCDRCGCDCSPRRVCRVVCEMKETSKTTYGCKCEGFCVPGPSQWVRSACSCGHCEACRHGNWIPGCGEIKTRKVVDKKVEKVSKPTYKWVVEHLCPECVQGVATPPPK